MSNTDLVKLWRDHGDRLRKHLPKQFRFHQFGDTAFFYLQVGRPLRDDITAIFLEHAARRVVEEEGYYVRAARPDGDPINLYFVWSMSKDEMLNFPVPTSFGATSIALTALFPTPEEKR